MNNFELVSVIPLSDRRHPRAIAKKDVADYRRRKSEGEQEPPPVGSIRRVVWTASVGHQRSRIERIKSALRGIVQKVVGC